MSAHYGASLEVSQPAIDRSGHDVVLEANGITRHVQLKASSLDAKTSKQNVHLGLAEKPSGCVVWVRFDAKTMNLNSFLFFGGLPGEPLPPIKEFKVTKHTIGNAQGDKKDRPNIRVIASSKFEKIENIPALYTALFG